MKQVELLNVAVSASNHPIIHFSSRLQNTKSDNSNKREYVIQSHEVQVKCQQLYTIAIGNVHIFVMLPVLKHILHIIRTEWKVFGWKIVVFSLFLFLLFRSLCPGFFLHIFIFIICRYAHTHIHTIFEYIYIQRIQTLLPFTSCKYLIWHDFCCKLSVLNIMFTHLIKHPRNSIYIQSTKLLYIAQIYISIFYHLIIWFIHCEFFGKYCSWIP